MKLKPATGGRAAFWCPGCDGAHTIVISGKDAWQFNGNYDEPTIQPSVKVNGYCGRKNTGSATHEGVCHSFITRGVISFLKDSTHALANQQAPLPDWP